MRIGINALPLSRVQAGAARVIRCVIEELRKIDSENCYYLYSDRDFELSWEGDRWRKRISAPLPLLPGTLWLQSVGRRMIISDQLDIFWATANILPLGLPSGMAKVVTIHDLIWPLFSKTADPFTHCMFWLFFRRSIRQADRVVTDSQSTAQDLVRVFAVPESKIEVIHLGVSPAYEPQDPMAAGQRVASKYGVSRDYLLTVGTIGPHKNLITLVEALRILRERGKLSFQLLVAGANPRRSARLLEAIQSSGLTGDHIRFLGFVPDEDLPLLYSGSSAYVFPSLYEGFGLPLVEALACGVPVIASNTSSIPEVAGDAALLVPPTQAGAFADAIQRVRSDEGLRRAMIEKGFRRAACFRWDKAARQLLECIRNVVGRKRSERRLDENRH
jgi:glycosyltransferase involved in cell wall biosynthesis